MHVTPNPYPQYVIYGRDGCKYCDMAKELLDRKEIPYTYHNISHDVDARNFILNEGFKTVPVVYKTKMSGKLYIGGFTELKEELG